MENKHSNTGYKGCLFLLLICVVTLISFGLLMDFRRAIGRYIYVASDNVKITFVLKPQENDELVLSIYDDFISPKEISEHYPIAQYKDFQDEYISDAFYCGFRDSIGAGNMYIWVQPYAKKIYAYDSNNLHFRDYILPPDSIQSNVFDVDLGLGISAVKVSPEKVAGLRVIELTWYAIIIDLIRFRLHH